MIYIAIALLAFSIFAFIFLSKEGIIPGVLSFLGSIALAIAGSIAVVPPGHVGVMVFFGAVQQNTLPEGLSFVNPFMSVSHMSGRTKTYTMSGEKAAIVALSSDGLRIPMDVSVVYRLDPTYASFVLQNIGYEYEDILLKPVSRTAVRQASAKFTAQQAYSTKRDTLALKMTSTLRANMKSILAQRGFKHQAIHIEQVLLRKVDLPDKVKAAIEDKLQAEQSAQAMTFVLEKERKEAERKEIEASGIQKFQEIVRKGIDAQFLKWKGIEATEKLASSANTKIVIIGGKDGLPVILNSATK